MAKRSHRHSSKPSTSRKAGAVVAVQASTRLGLADLGRVFNQPVVKQTPVLPLPVVKHEIDISTVDLELAFTHPYLYAQIKEAFNGHH